MPNNHPSLAANFHQLSEEAALAQLDTTPRGLSSEEARRRLETYGTNELPANGHTGPLVILWRQIHSLMTLVLVVAAILSILFGEWLDAWVIVLIFLSDIVIGFFQEYRAERALAALSKLLVLKAKVYRDHKIHVVTAKELVPGDVIVLENGDKVPADARLLFAHNLKASEASLTGESFPTEKQTPALPEATGLADRRNMVWMGTLITSGSGEAVISGTGLQTAVGDIARELARIQTPPGHFEKRMHRLTQQMAAIAISVAALTFWVGVFWRGFAVEEMLIFATAALVAGIPEGLPMVLVLVLAIGSRRMSKHNAIVRQLSAIETLGAVTSIVTDKTGTLTQNKMAVRAVATPEAEPIFAENNPRWFDWLEQSSHENSSYRHWLNIAAVGSSLLVSEDDKGVVTLLGDPTEVALAELAQHLGLGLTSANQRYLQLDDLGFMQEQRWRACLVTDRDEREQKEIMVSGAPEAVIGICQQYEVNGQIKALTPAVRASLLTQVQSLTDQAMRVVALAYRTAATQTTQLSQKEVRDLVYLGTVGIIDPPRPEVLTAIQQARQAGIRVIMATGDHPNTAIAIGRQIGLLTQESEGMVVNGADLEALDDAAFDQAVQKVVICARFTPRVKLRLAASLQRAGHIVAMTGDGVNDAPALKQADVGVSMAITGTEVAREASEIVLADDNFASIVSAIAEGRTQFRNVRRTTLFLVTTNIAESLAMLATIFLGWPLPLLPTQILWLNLVTDGVTDISLAVEPTHEDVLQAQPRDPHEQILTLSMLPFLIINAVIMVSLTVGAFWLFWSTDLVKARTVAFAILSWTQLFNVFNVRSLKKSLFQVGLFSNLAAVGAFLFSALLLVAVLMVPVLRNIFSFVQLSTGEMLLILVISSSVFWAIELYKWLGRSFQWTPIA